jgi:hypothetical protein
MQQFIKNEYNMMEKKDFFWQKEISGLFVQPLSIAKESTLR